MALRLLALGLLTVARLRALLRRRVPRLRALRRGVPRLAMALLRRGLRRLPLLRIAWVALLGRGKRLTAVVASSGLGLVGRLAARAVLCVHGSRRIPNSRVAERLDFTVGEEGLGGPERSRHRVPSGGVLPVACGAPVV